MEVLTHGGAPGGVGTSLALGYFDGVHTGHARVIGAADNYAKLHGLATAVFTFTIAPSGHKGSPLLPEEQKRAALSALGVEYCFEPEFGSFKNFTPQEFFERLILENYHAKAVFCGADYLFGAHRAGNTGTLRTLCARHGLYFEEIPMALYKGAPVSTSRIKAALAEGNAAAANEMLGRKLF